MNRRILPMPYFSQLSALCRIFLFLCIAAVVTVLIQRAGMRALAPSGSAFAASNNTPEEDGQWPMPAKDYANTRYSGLTDITTETVKQLKVAWTFSTGVNRGQEAAPLIVNNTMYIVTPYPNILYALDLTQPGALLKWKYEPKPAASAQGVACCDFVNRGAAYTQGKVFFNTLDAQTVAVDANTGKKVWKVPLEAVDKFVMPTASVTSGSY